MTIYLRLGLRLDVAAKEQHCSCGDRGPYGVYLAAGHIFREWFLEGWSEKIAIGNERFFASRGKASKFSKRNLNLGKNLTKVA